MSIIVGPNGQAERFHTTEQAEFRESLTDVARQIEDLNWVNLSTDRPSYDLVYDDRKRLLQRIRLYRRRNPLAKQGAALLQHYVLGKGISLKANNRAKIARIVDEFWDDPANSAVFTSHQAQKEAIDGLWTDGDMFIVLFPDTTNGTLGLGLLDAIFVEDIISDPNNSKVPKWYKARKPDALFNFTTGAWEARTSTDFEYYRDWKNDDPLGGKNSPPKKLLAEGLIYHVRINRRGKFGESEMAAAVDWVKAHKDFMEDRATLSHAAAQIAWKKKRKGSASDITTEVNRLQSSLVTNATRYESNPPPASGSTIVENEGTSIDWVKTDTGGANALADERILRMMAGSGMGGIPNHYFGDEANANLATATAMELPLLKNYEDWQKLWGDVVGDIIQFLLDTAHKAGRIGARDDTSKYADKVTTPRNVLGTADVKDDAQQPKNSAGQLPQGAFADTSPSTTRVQEVREAFGQPAAASSAPGISTAAASAVQTKDPAVALTLIPKTEPEVEIEDEEDKTGLVDWYVDVNFPPILQRDLAPAMDALKVLYEFLPVGNIESQKLVVEMALSLLGENDIDEAMERLFPPDMTPQQLQAQQATPGTLGAQDPNAFMTALKGVLGAAGGSQKASLVGASGGQDVTSAQDASSKPAGVAESLAEYRVRRVLRAAREATDALDAVGA